MVTGGTCPSELVGKFVSAQAMCPAIGAVQQCDKSQVRASVRGDQGEGVGEPGGLALVGWVCASLLCVWYLCC